MVRQERLVLSITLRFARRGLEGAFARYGVMVLAICLGGAVLSVINRRRTGLFLLGMATIAGALQPIVVRHGLQGLPAKALYSWEPTAMLGIYRLDEIHWNKAAGKEARR